MSARTLSDLEPGDLVTVEGYYNQYFMLGIVPKTVIEPKNFKTVWVGDRKIFPSIYLTQKELTEAPIGSMVRTISGEVLSKVAVGKGQRWVAGKTQWRSTDAATLGCLWVQAPVSIGETFRVKEAKQAGRNKWELTLVDEFDRELTGLFKI